MIYLFEHLTCEKGNIFQYLHYKIITKILEKIFAHFGSENLGKWGIPLIKCRHYVIEYTIKLKGVHKFAAIL